MAAGIYNFTIEQGSTLSFDIQYLDSNSNPVDLTGYEARMQIRSSIDATGTIASLSSSLDLDGTGLYMSGSTNSLPPSSGSIGIVISAASSSLFSFTEAVYDLEIYSGSIVNRLVKGTIKLDKKVTR